MPRGLISIGTNSTRLLILADEVVVDAQSVGTRLGRGLGSDGALDPNARAETLRTIEKYIADLRAAGATLDVIATSALRRANDAAEFCRAVESIAGVLPRILSGDEEAGFSFSGATWGSHSEARVGVLDVGGGSTELAVGTRTVIERTVSVEIGAVRLSERFPALLGGVGLDEPARVSLVQRARMAASDMLAPLATFAPFADLLAVGGTVFTAAAMIAGDPLRDRVGLSRHHIATLIDDLLARDLTGRRALAHIRPQRADILPAGLIIVDTACERLGIAALTVSHADLLAGYLRSGHYRCAAAPPERSARGARTSL